MTQSEVDKALIKRGFWVNHAQGSVLGATITLDQQYSNVIVALIAVVVATAAGSAFNLFLFGLYQSRATDKTKDGLYWQQQALYRSLATPGTVLMDSLKLLHAWRRQSLASIWTRCLVPASIGLLFALGSLAAGIFSSYIIKTTNLPVLVRSEQCCLLNYTAYLTGDLKDDVYSASLNSAARSFAQRCYTPGSLPSECNFYIRPRVVPKLEFIDCPFDASLCYPGVKAVVLDSGYLDSNDDLGINAPSTDRVLVRRKVTCVPLDTAKRTSVLNSNDSRIANVTSGVYPPQLEDFNSWWTVRFGTGDGLSDNITTLHSTLASNVSTKYSHGYV